VSTRAHRFARALGAALLLAGGATACRITPDEIERIETENDLLRQQIQRMRVECGRYRDLDLEIGDPAEKPAPP
jgi:hypothetical protein